MKYLVMFLVMFFVSCGIVPDGETYVTDESIRSDNTSTAEVQKYVSLRGR